MGGFSEFWAVCPRKVGRLAAEKEYAKALKRGATPQQILAGMERYTRTKPAYADWCHPRTWLSQGRYLDEDDTPLTPAWTPCNRVTDTWRCVGGWQAKIGENAFVRDADGIIQRCGCRDGA